MFSLGLSSPMSNTSKIRDSSFHQGLSALHRVSRWMLANYWMFKFLYTLVKMTPPVLVSYIICIKQITLKLIYWFNKGWFGHWKLRVGKLLFGGHSSKSLHCSICPNAQWPITNDQFTKQPFLIQLYKFVQNSGCLQEAVLIPSRVSRQWSLIANKQPRKDVRLRGGSLIEPCAIVPGAEKISNRCNI